MEFVDSGGGGGHLGSVVVGIPCVPTESGGDGSREHDFIRRGGGVRFFGVFGDAEFSGSEFVFVDPEDEIFGGDGFAWSGKGDSDFSSGVEKYGSEAVLGKGEMSC